MRLLLATSLALGISTIVSAQDMALFPERIEESTTILPATPGFASSQTMPNAAPAASMRYETHLLMLTHFGPNHADASKYQDRIAEHHARFSRFAEEGIIVAGGPLDGPTPGGLTVWASGIDEARARKLVGDDVFFANGIVTPEFRVMTVRYGKFSK